MWVKISTVERESQGQEMQKVSADIQAILTVLGRRTRTYGKGESERLNLSKTNLQGANLEGAQLQRVNLVGAQLQHASLRWAQLQRADFAVAQLQSAPLGWAWLQGANLQSAQLQGADLHITKNLTQEQINMACVDEKT
jgi:uncharacterized protein YjbI with pentapeptide repeats